jgi:predicted nucleic acid-binding protein
MGALDGFAGVFLDASFLIAFHAPGDASHQRAVALMRDVEAAGSKPITIWDCIGESLTLLRRHFGYRQTLALADNLENLALITYDTSHRLDAVARFRKLSRARRISFVDVLCAVVIERELPETPALSFDRDFRALGLTVIR